MKEQADDREGVWLDERSVRIARENIERLKAFKANPPPAPAQKDYIATPMTTTLTVPTRKERQRAAFAAKIEAKYNRKYEPVRVVAVAPYPVHGESLLDLPNSESTNSK